MYNKNQLKRYFSGLLLIVVILLIGFILFVNLSKIDRFYFLSKYNGHAMNKKIEVELKKMSSLIEFTQNTPQDLADILEIHQVNLNEIEILLGSFLFNNPEFSGTAICFEPYCFTKDSLYQGYFLYRNGDSTVFINLNDPAYNYFYKDWYLVPKTLQKSTWSEPYYDESSGKLTATYSVPFYQFDGEKRKFNGIVTLDLEVNTLTEFAQEIGNALHGKAFLISENGTILSAPNKDWIYNETIFTLSSEMQMPELREVGRELQQGKSGKKNLDLFEGKENVMAVYKSIKINNWGLIILLSKD